MAVKVSFLWNRWRIDPIKLGAPLAFTERQMFLGNHHLILKGQKMRLRNDNRGSGEIAGAITGVVAFPIVVIICIYLLSTIAPALQSAAPNDAAAEVIQETENKGYLALTLLFVGGGVASLFALFALWGKLTDSQGGTSLQL